MIKQQIEVSKSFTDTSRQISVLIRAADLLWPQQQDKARAVFTDAFELATENEKDNQQKGSRSIILTMQNPDQRYVVIRAVAKRDSAWAKELSQQMLKRADDSEASSRGSFDNTLNANRLLDSAYRLVDTDINAALNLATLSLNYPASFLLTRFLYRVALVNQQLADQFYAQALAIYGDKPIREFLYLQAYPFAWSETLDTPVSANHDVPANFTINQALQRQFVQVLLRFKSAHASELLICSHVVMGYYRRRRLSPRTTIPSYHTWGSSNHKACVAYPLHLFHGKWSNQYGPGAELIHWCRLPSFAAKRKFAVGDRDSCRIDDARVRTTITNQTKSDKPQNANHFFPPSLSVVINAMFPLTP